MKLRVLIPSPKPGNTFFEEVLLYSFCEFEYGNLDTDIANYDMVLFHWPELIFKWAEPSDKQLSKLEQKLSEWKDSVKIVYLVHNEKPHFGMTSRLEKLYQLILTHTDAMVHFGNYSLEKYKIRFPQKTHQFIRHPLYEKTFEIVAKEEARRKLGLSISKKIILVPGRVRTIEERALIVSSYKTLNIKDKYLLVPYMFKKKMPLHIKGSYRLQRLKIIKNIISYFYNREYLSSHKFSYKRIKKSELSLMMSAADVVLIPRIDTLNSGILYLGLTYKKIMVGPAIGNIEEFLDDFKLPKFYPEKPSSFSNEIQNGFDLKKKYVFNEKKLDAYSPKNVAKQWDQFLMKLTKN